MSVDKTKDLPSPPPAPVELSSQVKQPSESVVSHLQPTSTVSVDTIRPGVLCVIKRNGTVVPYDAEKIKIAIIKTYLDAEGTIAANSPRVREKVERFTNQITETFVRRMPSGGPVRIEEIQDLVELEMMRAGEHQPARRYVLYREKRTSERDAKHSSQQPHEGTTSTADSPSLNVLLANGQSMPLDRRRLEVLAQEACEGLVDVSPEGLLENLWQSLYDGIAEADLSAAMVIAARTLVEEEPNYSYVTARLLLDTLRKEALGFLGVQRAGADEDDSSATQQQMVALYPRAFVASIKKGISLEHLDPRLQERFDLDRLGASLKPERDSQFTYLGLQTLYDRYFIHSDQIRFELPQTFFMRVAMGLSLEEEDPNARALEFYHVLSKFLYMSSTPTLFNAGTLKSQLSSCYLSTVPDNLDGIFSAIKDNALLSKWAGGLGNDWTPVRSLGSYIKGTNGKSEGIVPFLKVANDTAVAVNQGGKRKGALCSYLETWHLDIEQFIELRKNTGDDRRRTHDMNTANWVPDLFMKRVFENADWTLFSPNDVPDLHDLTGTAFERRYEEYESQADAGKIRLFKRLKANNLWRKMLSMLFETGHPWITFKDSCNLRSPQQHVGVVHSSNLCTEITLNTSEQEIAVCNLGSVNLAAHRGEAGLDFDLMRTTVNTAVRMLDNVIDINLYAVPQAKRANLRHRAIGLGMMGFQDVLYKERIPYGSEQAVEFSDEVTEVMSYFAIEASSNLAAERGCYESFKGSLWSQGILPIDSLDILARERGIDEYLQVDRKQRLDWDSLRTKVTKVGMRNSNVLAIAPTATIANITGVLPCIEPAYQNIYVKSNLSGEFTVINPYLVDDLKQLGIWDKVMASDLKYYDGSLRQIDRIPDEIKTLYATAFEIDPKWVVQAASRRQKWLDQAQSLNLYFAGGSGHQLDQMYRMAWVSGLKTTYYLRSLAATDTEKSTVEQGQLNAVDVGQQSASASLSTGFSADDVQAAVPASCALDDEDCEACQ